MQETQVRFLGQEDPLEKGTATHSSILVWRIPWTEEPGGLQSMGSQRVGHDCEHTAHSSTRLVFVPEGPTPTLTEPPTQRPAHTPTPGVELLLRSFSLA